jgi:hypothetical protein
MVTQTQSQQLYGAAFSNTGPSITGIQSSEWSLGISTLPSVILPPQTQQLPVVRAKGRPLPSGQDTESPIYF